MLVTLSYYSLLLRVSGRGEESREAWGQVEWHDGRHAWHEPLSAAASSASPWGPSWIRCRRVCTTRWAPHFKNVILILTWDSSWLFCPTCGLSELPNQSNWAEEYCAFNLLPYPTICTPCTNISGTPSTGISNLQRNSHSNFGVTLTPAVDQLVSPLCSRGPTSCTTFALYM